MTRWCVVFIPSIPISIREDSRHALKHNYEGSSCGIGDAFGWQEQFQDTRTWFQRRTSNHAFERNVLDGRSGVELVLQEHSMNDRPQPRELDEIENIRRVLSVSFSPTHTTTKFAQSIPRMTISSVVQMNPLVWLVRQIMSCIRFASSVFDAANGGTVSHRLWPLGFPSDAGPVLAAHPVTLNSDWLSASRRELTRSACRFVRFRRWLGCSSCGVKRALACWWRWLACDKDPDDEWDGTFALLRFKRRERHPPPHMGSSSEGLLCWFPSLFCLWPFSDPLLTLRCSLMKMVWSSDDRGTSTPCFVVRLIWWTWASVGRGGFVKAQNSLHALGCLNGVVALERFWWHVERCHGALAVHLWDWVRGQRVGCGTQRRNGGRCVAQGVSLWWSLYPQPLGSHVYALWM